MIPQQPAPDELREVFRSETLDPRAARTVSRELPANVEWCVMRDGVHYGPPNCPHTRTEDELGPVKDNGWTVQQG